MNKNKRTRSPFRFLAGLSLPGVDGVGVRGDPMSATGEGDSTPSHFFFVKGNGFRSGFRFPEQNWKN
jgi:hypothetical protein